MLRDGALPARAPVPSRERPAGLPCSGGSRPGDPAQAVPHHPSGSSAGSEERGQSPMLVTRFIDTPDKVRW